jgi:TP901 family phage tail tape measure protein
LADLDPRIAQFNKAAAEALAATRRAGQEVNRLTAKTKTAADQQSRLSTRAKGATNVVSEEATPRVVRASEQRTAAYQAEQAALARLNKTRAEGITKLDAEALTRQAAFRNVQQYGPYAGGRRNFDQFGYGGGSGPPSIPPGGRVPPPGGFPALPPAGGTGNVPKPSVITAGIEQESKRYVEAQANAQRYTQSVSRLAQEQNLASQAMRKNGALTTEFISAAQRGEVTIRELGYQTTATIGKFGGWLAAGSAVYGAFAAVSKLGAGALDAYSGVNQLERVIRTGINADQLKGEFSDLAGEFNLPVETVTEAVYQMGKVFHTQSGAIAAANSVLYSTKVGELDVADATRYLIAIVNGFHLPASKMAEVFDQINAAQNEFGITISDVEAGLAKASGTFNAAGGSYSNLLALITTAQKATGNTGDVVGTALARAPNFLRKPENEQILKEFGIQPSQAIDKIIEDAFEISGELSGKKLQVLAAAIFGPQYGARIGTPLLQQGNLFEEVKRKTSPEAAKGSAARELDKQLGSVNEQISRVGVSFERLGAQLADSHALDAAGGLLQLLNLTLDAAISLTEAFNALPDGLQQALVYGGQLALLLRGLRRLNLGETIAGPTGQATGVRGAAAEFFGRGPIGEARLYRQALIAEKQDLEQKVATATTQGTQAAGVQQAARARLERENARAAALAPAALGPGASEKSVAAYDDSVRKVQALNSELATTEEVQQRMAAQADFYNKELGRVDQSMRNVTGRFGTLDTRGALTDRERRTGVQYYGRTFERPSSTRPLTGPGAQLPLFGGVDALAKEEAATVKGAEDTMQRAEAQVNRNQAAVGRLSQAGGRLSSAFNGIINRLGTVFFVAGVGLALYQVYDSIKSSLQSDLDALEKAATSRADIKSIAKEAPKDYSSVSRGIAEVLRGESFLPGIGEDPESYVKRLFSGGGETETEILEAADKARIQSAKNILKLQAKQRNKGLPQQFRYSDELRKEVQKIASSNKSRAQKLEEFARVETENEQDFDTLYHGRNNTKGQKAVEQAIEIAKAVNGTVKDYRDILQKLDGKELDEIAANYAGVITGATGKFNPRAAQKAALAYEEQVRRLSGNSSPKAQKELLDAQQQYYEALSGGITSELTLSLQRARSPQQRAEAAAKALHQVAAQYKTGPARRFRQQREAVEKAEDELAGAQDLERDRTNGGPSFNLPAGGGRKAIDRAKTSLKAQREKLKRLGKAAREQSEAGEILEEELRQQIFESVSAVRDAKFQYKISLTADPLKQAALELRQVNADLPGAIRAYGKDSAEVYALLQQKQQALANQVQQELALISARADLSAAGIDPSDTLAQDRAAVSKVEAELAFMRSHANRFDPAQIIQQEASLRKAQIQLAEDIEQEAIDLQNAAFQRKINQAEVNDHPVRAAQLAINQTKYQIRNAKTPVEKANLEADLVSQYGAKRDAVAQAALDNIEFKASIEKITTTQEIAALERLLHDYKLSRDMRRQIRQQIFNLKNGEGSEGGFELDVGSITLPTVYDIRRAIQGGVQAQAGVNVTNAPTVTVNNFSSDPAVVGRALSRVLGGSTASALRSAGVGG